LQHKNKAQEKEKEKRKSKDLGLETVREERARGENKQNWVCRVDIVVQIGFATHHCFFNMTCLSTIYNYCLNASAMKWWMAFGISFGIESRKRKKGSPRCRHGRWAFLESNSLFVSLFLYSIITLLKYYIN
jgi:hypothetical protein